MTEFLEFFRTKQVVYRWYLPQCLHTEGYFSTRAFDLQLPLHVKAVVRSCSSISDTTRRLARFGVAEDSSRCGTSPAEESQHTFERFRTRDDGAVPSDAG